MNNSVKKNLTVLPTNQLLAQVWDYLITRPSKRGEHKKEILECLFLLGWKVGLRVSESLSFDLSLEHGERRYKGLYLLRGKGKKERWVYVGEDIAKELQKRNWQPNQTTRFTFSKFLEQVKEEMEIADYIELTLILSGVVLLLIRLILACLCQYSKKF